MSWTHRCDICQKHFEISAYGDGQCPHCLQSYIYEEGHMIVLTERQLEALRALKRAGSDIVTASSPPLRCEGLNESDAAPSKK